MKTPNAETIASTPLRWRRALALLACCALAAVDAHADWTFDAGAGALYDDNLSRAFEPEVKRADAAATASVSAWSFVAPSAADGWTFSLGAGGELYHRYHGLDNAYVSAGVSYRHKFDVGYEAPWLLLAAEGSYHSYDVDLRSGPRLLMRIETGKRFGTSVAAWAGVSYDAREAPHDGQGWPGVGSDVYDLHGTSAYLGATTAFGERLTLGASAAVRRGDVASTSSDWGPLFDYSSAVADDPTFGPNLYVYRLRGTTLSAAATLSWALSDRSSLNLSFSGERTSVTQGYDYVSRATRLAWLYRY